MSKNIRKRIVIAVALATVCSVNLVSRQSVKVSATGNTVKNVIMLIADGMNTDALTLARHINGGTLAMDEISVGTVQTNWANGPITDSAPAATAMSTGNRTLNKYLGTSVEDIPLATILEASEQEGKSTGLIATSEIPHATPAGFSSHTTSRSRYDDILRQMINNDLEVVLGGGFNLETDELTNEMKYRIANGGYDFIETKDAMDRYNGDKLWGAFANADMDYDLDRDNTGNNQPSLSEMTSKSLEILNKDEDGFFLMIEGSKVDWAAHENAASGMISDIIAFDKAVEQALEFARNREDTVVIVTTDHGNSGLSIGNYDNTEGTSYEKINQYKSFTITEEHFNNNILGTLNLDEKKIRQSVKEYFGLTDLTFEEIEMIKENKINKVISDRTAIGFTTGGHTGENVYLGIYTPVSVKKLNGVIDNTRLATYMSELLFGDIDRLNSLSNELYKNGKESLESLGAKVEIDTTDLQDLKVKVTNKNNEIELKLNTNDYKLNGEEKSLKSVMPYIYKTDINSGEFYVPQELLDVVSSLTEITIVEIENKDVVTEVEEDSKEVITEDNKEEITEEVESNEISEDVEVNDNGL
ncbi:MAG: alkaline phosphatase [Clostridium sp.]